MTESAPPPGAGGADAGAGATEASRKLRAGYARWLRETARFADTDMIGHVNNAVFSTFCESGRVDFLVRERLAPSGTSFVIARLELDFRAEIHAFEHVDVGTRVESVGRSSFRVGQGLFVGERCVATAQSVIVLMDRETRRATVLPPDLRARLAALGPAG